MKLHIYLNYDGTTEEAFNFYKSVFGGEFISVNRFGEMPDDGSIPEAVKNKIMHISLPVGENMVLMASDNVEGFGPGFAAGNNYNIMIDPDSKEQAAALYAKLSEGGQVVMPLEDTFWGAYYGHFIDKFGTGWMINYTYPQHG